MAGKSVALPECGLCMKSVKNGVQCGDCRKLFHFSCSLFKVKNCVEDDWRCSSCCKKRERRRRRTEKDNIILRLRKELEEEKERVKRLALENEELKNFKSEPGTVQSEKGMVFHSRIGSNVKISNNGRTIEKKNIVHQGHGAAFTSRPLKNDELFEVTLDKRGSELTVGFGIGVLTVRPEDFEFPRLAYASPHAWMYHDFRIYTNGDIKRSNYGVDINELPAGTRFGVMKKSTGVLNFFINGEGMPSDLSGFDGLVYGVAELYYNAEKITILQP